MAIVRRSQNSSTMNAISIRSVFTALRIPIIVLVMGGLATTPRPQRGR